MVDKAQGVFLWLELVTRVLVIEIKKDRGMQRTYQNVASLPSDLEKYFMNLICETIDHSSGNISDTASALKLASVLHEPDSADYKHSETRCTFIDFWLLSRGALTALMLFPEPDTARFGPWQTAVMLQQTRSFLEQSCKDLMIIVESPADSDDMRISCPLDQSVQYLHRSAYEFLTNGPLKLSIEQGSPLHFREKGFLPKLTAIRAAYRLLELEVGCLRARTAFHDAVVHQTAFLPGDRAQFLRICESFATTHISVSCNCLGEAHKQLPSLPFVEPAIGDASIPYSYIRALLCAWRHSTVRDNLRVSPGLYHTDRRGISRGQKLDL